jgi:hypothetical protein
MENLQLTVSDIVSCKNVIEAACNRGAFKANEMKQIGELYEKLSVFVNAAAEQINSSNTEEQGK